MQDQNKRYQDVEQNYLKALYCFVCFKPYDSPKILPVCKHSICKNCLGDQSVLGSASTLDDNDKVTIECPRCGITNKISMDIDRLVSNRILKKVIHAIQPEEDALIKNAEEHFNGEKKDRKKVLDGSGKGYGRNYFLQWSEKPVSLFKANSSVIKLIFLNEKPPMTIMAVCMNGTVLGLPAYSAVGRMSWKGRLRPPDAADVSDDMFGIFHVDYDEMTKSVFTVLMSPNGGKGVFYARLADIVLGGVKSGVKMNYLIPPVDSQNCDTGSISKKEIPSNFLGITFEPNRRLLFACHADYTDLTVWSIEAVENTKGRKAFHYPTAKLLQIIRSKEIPGLQDCLAFKASYCAVFSPPMSDNLQQYRFIAISNMWDSKISVIVTIEQSCFDDESCFNEKPVTVISVAAGKGDDLAEKSEYVFRPRDVYFDDFGNLFVADHDNNKIKVFSFKKLSENLWSPQLEWSSLQLPSQPMTITILKDRLDSNSDGKQRPTVGCSSLFNHDIVFFQSD